MAILVSSYVNSKDIHVHVECCCISDCEYDMQTYRHMESFLASYDPCLNCSCTNSIVRCIPIMCPHRDFPCRNPIRKGKGCCEFVCPSKYTCKQSFFRVLLFQQILKVPIIEFLRNCFCNILGFIISVNNLML